MAIFVLHPDLDVLTTVVSHLRDRGLDTVHGTEPRTLIERSAKLRARLLIAPEGLDVSALRGPLGAPPELTFAPFAADDAHAALRLVDAATSALAAAVRAEVPATSSGEVRGDLAQLPLADLLQMLSLGRKTGTLTVTTSSGAGELRLHDGEVVDASFRRAEGMKAVIRLLGERDGAFHFAPDAAPALRRIRAAISTILMEGTRQVDEVARLREALGLPPPATHVALSVATPDSIAENDVIARDVAVLLAQPRVLDDLLDDAPKNDLDVLQALFRIDARGLLRRIPIGDLRPSMAGPEGMVVLRTLARRLRPRGYRTASRLVLAGDAATVRLARSALPRLVEALPGPDVGGELGADRAIEGSVHLQLGEGIGLDVVTIVDRGDVAPAWPLVLAGALALVTLSAPSPALASLVEELEVALIDGHSRGEQALDASDPSSLGAALRAAVEALGAS